MPQKTKRKSPSRQKYEAEHPTMSCRLDKSTHKRLTEHLNKTGCSFADFVKDALGREESMIDKRVEMLAKQKAPPSLEERIRCCEGLIYQLALYCNNHYEPLVCPHCPNQELSLAWGDETESPNAEKEIPVLKCPKCGYFPDTYRRIDAQSVKWNADILKSASELKTSAKK